MELLNVALAGGIVFGPVLGYIPQYNEISRKRDPECFSTHVCFILLVSNILRVFFWVGKRFEYALLFQSLAMIVAQLLVLELIIRLRVENSSQPSRKNYKIPLTVNWRRFWHWSAFGDYLCFLLLLSGSLGAVTALNLLYLQSVALTEIIGTAALTLEATLAMPQFHQNYVNKSTKGLRMELIFSWLAGDSFKTFFFIYRHAPFQFIMCGITQLVMDCAILVQIFIYRSPEQFRLPQGSPTSSKTPSRRKSPARP